MLRLMGDPGREDVGALSQFVTYSRRLRDKLLRFAKIASREMPASGEQVADGSQVTG